MLTNNNLSLGTILFSLTTLLMLTGCNNGNASDENKPVVYPTKIYTVAANNTANLYQFPALVEANITSKLSFRVSGQLISLPVKAGTIVKKGDLLAKLDAKDFQLTVNDREARYKLAQAQFKRSEELLAKRLVPQSAYDEAKANLAVALASFDSAQTALQYTQLVAPFAGTVTNIMVDPDENIRAQQPILTLQFNDIIDVAIDVPENIMADVKKDAPYQATVIFNAHPLESFKATIKEWDTQANPATLTYKVVFSLPAPKAFNVLPGMSAKVNLALNSSANKQFPILVPTQAVFFPEDKPLNGNQAYVWKITPKNMVITKQAVTVGSIKNQGIEILSGLNTSDMIATTGIHFLKEGMQVKAWQREKGL
jgi:RND family efflux transporter MFP subunit